MPLTPVVFTKLNETNVSVSSGYAISGPYQSDFFYPVDGPITYARMEYTSFGGSIDGYFINLLEPSELSYTNNFLSTGNDIAGYFDGTNIHGIVTPRSGTGNNNEIVYAIGGSNNPVVSTVHVISAVTFPLSGQENLGGFPDLTGLTTGASTFVAAEMLDSSFEVYIIVADSVIGDILNAIYFSDITDFQSLFGNGGYQLALSGGLHYLYNWDSATNKPTYSEFLPGTYTQGGIFVSNNFSVDFDDPIIAGGTYYISGMDTSNVYYTGLDLNGASVGISIPIGSNNYDVIRFSQTIDLFTYYNGIFIGIDTVAGAIWNIGGGSFTRNPQPFKIECANYCIPMIKQRKNYHGS